MSGLLNALRTMQHWLQSPPLLHLPLHHAPAELRPNAHLTSVVAITFCSPFLPLPFPLLPLLRMRWRPADVAVEREVDGDLMLSDMGQVRRCALSNGTVGRRGTTQCNGKKEDRRKSRGGPYLASRFIRWSPSRCHLAYSIAVPQLLHSSKQR